MDTQTPDPLQPPPVETPKTPTYQVMTSCLKCTTVFSTTQVTEAAFNNMLGTPNFQAVLLDDVHTARTQELCPSCANVIG